MLLDASTLSVSASVFRLAAAKFATDKLHAFVLDSRSMEKSLSSRVRQQLYPAMIFITPRRRYATRP